MSQGALRGVIGRDSRCQAFYEIRDVNTGLRPVGIHSCSSVLVARPGCSTSSSCDLELTFYPCRASRPSHHMLLAPKRWEAAQPTSQTRPIYRSVLLIAAPWLGTGGLSRSTFFAYFVNPSRVSRRRSATAALQLRPGRDHPIAHVAPQIDQQPPCHRHNANAAHSATPCGKATPVPLTELALRLILQP